VLQERENKTHFDVVSQQLKDGLFHLTDAEFANIVIAYEPVWAIGTGVTATPEQAQEMHAFIRDFVADNYNREIADSTTILYGGSCNSGNAKELFSNTDVDGGLIGGASLKADEFIKIAESF
jgi:triosephosphate isomerase